MNAGGLRERIELFRVDGDTEKWEDDPFYQCWAYANGLSGSEYWAARAQQAENTVVFTARYCRALEHVAPQDFKIVFRNATYDIVSVDHVQFRGMWVKIKAVQKNGR